MENEKKDFTPYGVSIVQKHIKELYMLKLMEDALKIHRINRLPEQKEEKQKPHYD